ncbi:MAG TPA: hypothetical protein VEG33_07730 [Streptosporangiaceae bacterium]|nr:hypothetical protein [Streptosporangiaceae bacterium]
MNENARVRDDQVEQTAPTRQPWELDYGHRSEDRPDPLREPYEPTQEELDLLYSQVPGHRWNGWRRLTGDEDYFAACSCGWRSTETDHLSPMLGQVKGHLDAVRAIRGWRPSARITPAPARDERERDASPRQIWQEHTQELYASVQSQQKLLAEALEDSTGLLSASEEQADRFVMALEHAVAEVGPEWPRPGAPARRAEVLQRRIERAKELRNGIVAAAAAMAAIAEEVALVHQDRETRHPSSTAEHQRLGGEASQPGRKAREGERTSSD